MDLIKLPRIVDLSPSTPEDQGQLIFEAVKSFMKQGARLPPWECAYCHRPIPSDYISQTPFHIDKYRLKFCSKHRPPLIAYLKKINPLQTRFLD